ncbi:hypothetical protein GJ688_07590 [Heliobacillus mobilis]|uniref:SMODS and SLOG-associating 2TM effector domain-containing protein n=1 Tax=Heliobacterium mobile TaxID=28064 RepID=A0A6I3SIY9_HELMO|nr:hypothetical protein [Heliobacterium mobile]MTV48843.1 hypothetical protein [Heliobacterium mobile]
MIKATGTYDRNEPLIPIVIGVTGHRDLRNGDRLSLEEQVRKIFNDLRSSYPHTPVVLLSPLAEGADRLVAQVALDCGCRLIVPLLEEGEANVTETDTESSRAEYLELVKKADRVVSIPLSVREGEPNSDALRYARIGAYIVRHSHILIALWDGVDNGRIGGSAHVVRFKCQGIGEPYAPPRNLLDPIDTGMVYHIVTPRDSNPTPKGKPFQLVTLFPGDGKKGAASANSERRIFEQIEAYNADAVELIPKKSEAICQSREWLWPGKEESVLTDRARSLLDHYALSDMMAIHFADIRRSAIGQLFALGLAAVLFFELYAHMFLESRLMLGLYPLTLFIAYLIYRRANSKNYQNKHLDYRALAEGLRIQFFWHLAGLDNEVADHYLRKQRNELLWLRNAIRFANIAAGCADGNQQMTMERDALSTSKERKLLELLNTHWIQNQCNFFEKASKRDRHKLEGFDRWIEIFFVGGLALSVIVVALDPYMHHLYEDFKHAFGVDLHHLLIVFMGFTPAIAATFEGYAEKSALSDQSKQYEVMSEIFQRAATEMSRCLVASDYSAAQGLVLELGKEALAENGDWVHLHRARPLQVRRA